MKKYKKINKMIFELSEEQWEMYEKWHDEQMIKDNKLPTAGERFTFCFTPTGLGMIVNVIDEHLNEKIDLTDWENF